MIFAAMLLLGAILGFVGAGGSGLTITLLTVGFGVPIHSALGAALAAMSFTMLSGAISHFREGDVDLKIGIATGISGIGGSLLGTSLAHFLPARLVATGTACMLLVTACLMYMQVFHNTALRHSLHLDCVNIPVGWRFWRNALLIGLGTGFLSGAFGIGATAFIQICLMLFFGLSLYLAIGTTMLVILPISIAGGLGYLYYGYLDWSIFLQTACGLAAGAFIGAKFTRLVPNILLRYVVVATPVIGGLILLINT